MNARSAALAAVILVLCSVWRPAAAQTSSVVNSPHDLSAGSRSAVRAANEDQVCIFCHAPHNASPVAALWNRSLSPQAYTIYSSKSLNARPGQPTGSSKLCLSCHDGTIALGNVLSRGGPILMSGGVTTMPHGLANLGTDLRDDHPISFRFDSALAGKNGHLRDPATLPRELPLDNNRELQCTTCHDAHNNSLGKFLVMRNSDSALCMSCHKMGRTDIQGHGQCRDCHQTHSAPSGPYLLVKKTVTQTCLACHDGSVHKAANIAADMHKAYVHDTASPVDPTGPATGVATCTSCHDPHTMTHGLTGGVRAGPSTSSLGRLGLVTGINASGTPVRMVGAEQEVCFKCHGDGNKRTPTIQRKRVQNNTRQQFSPSAISMHPVGSPGRALRMPSLKPGWTTSSSMRCSDCHGSESGNTAGVHGSNLPGLLTARYETADRTIESASSYALCYKCHDRGSVLGNQSFPGHSLHVVDARTPCSACHDSHGIAAGQGGAMENTHLINFATSIVLPDRITGRLEYRDTGGFTGECFLSCHGVDHSPKRYPSATGARPTLPHPRPTPR